MPTPTIITAPSAPSGSTVTGTLYVGNLPPATTEKDLATKFGRFGTVNSARILMDPKAGCRRRFGVVEMSSRAEAEVAVGWLNMTQFDETVISVSFASRQMNQLITEELARGQTESPNTGEATARAGEKGKAQDEG